MVLCRVTFQLLRKHIMSVETNSVSRLEISAELAQQMIEQCIGYAKERQWEICATICDPRGHPVVLQRTNNVVVPAIQYAVDKAWTAATLGTSTEAFYERAASRPALAMGLSNRERVLVFPGGFPVLDNGICIGGLGVSGAKDEEDVEIATRIIEQYGFKWS